MLRIERDAPRSGLWRFWLDDPPRSNALSPLLVSQLYAGLQEAFESDARAIVIASSTERFCAGFDLSDIDRVPDTELRERFEAIESLLEAIRRAPLLTIALVRGAALGAGADLVAACDYRLGTSNARLAFPGIRFGVILGTRHLTAVVGGQRAREILLEGKALDAAQACAAGLLSGVYGADALDARAAEILTHAEALDAGALRALLRLTRDAASQRDLDELMRSTALPGLGERMRTHARRAAQQRVARRATTQGGGRRT